MAKTVTIIDRIGRMTGEVVRETKTAISIRLPSGSHYSTGKRKGVKVKRHR